MSQFWKNTEVFICLPVAVAVFFLPFLIGFGISMLCIGFLRDVNKLSQEPTLIIIDSISKKIDLGKKEEERREEKISTSLPATL
jgi:hypothetical protein